LKTQIKISNQIEIILESLPEHIRKIITQELTLNNPDFLQAEKMDKYTGHLQRYIYLYQQNGNSLIFPRGYATRLIALLKQEGQEYQIDSQALTLPPVDFGSRIKLRPYQLPGAKSLVKNVQGGLVAPCGSGKTETMLAVMAAVKQPALWITHTKELLEQVIKRALKSFNGMTRDEIGVIAEGKVNVGERLTVALVQTLSRIDINEIADKFGAVFVDEAHHLGADSFYNAVSKLPARYRLWCSATPEREDGLTPMITAVGGPVQYTIQDKNLPTLKPELVVVKTKYTGFIDPENYPGMVKDLTTDTTRNQLIIDTVTKAAPGHYSLVLSDRIKHLITLKSMIEKSLPGMSIEILTGQLSKKQRTDIMERAKARQVDILLATQLAREGLDLPHLDRLFLVTPKRAGNATEQEIGRIRRPCECKQDAVIFDFWDTENPIFKAQFWKRRAIYKKLNIKIGA